MLMVIVWRGPSASFLPSALYVYMNLAYLPAQPFLAEAVPKVEGDYPCISRKPVIRNQSKGLRAVRAW